MISSTHAEALIKALHAEARLLGELTSVMRNQRDAIARDDLDALDDAVFATHRVLLTLGEARRRRKALNELIGEGDDLSLETLRACFDHEPPPDIGDAITDLANVANALHREVEVNRRVLRHAIDSGDQLLRTLCGVSPSPETYDRIPTPAPSQGSVLFDRRV